MKFFSKTMKLNNIDTVPYLTYNSLSEISFINHAFTTRLGGVSTGEFTSMNMAFNRGDNPDSQPLPPDRHSDSCCKNRKGG